MGLTRVLRIITRLNVGGPTRQALFLTDELRNRGYDTRLVWGETGPREGQIDPPAGLPATYVPTLRRELSPLDDARAFGAISGVIDRWRPQIVHTHMAKAGALGRLAAVRSRPVVTVHTFHGHVLQEYFSGLKSHLFAQAERALASRTDALVAVAPRVRDELLAAGIGRPSQWHVIPVGLDLEELRSHRPDPLQARRALGLPDYGPVIAGVGRLAPVKDHHTLISTMTRVIQRHRDATLLIAGDGELRGKLEQRARALLRDQVIFAGWVRDLPTLYAACDVVALTSRNEGTPIALIEAAAAGKPVVATDVGGVSEVVRDGFTGRLCAAGDDRAIAAALVALLDSPATAHAMGEQAAAWVTPRFAQERLVRDIDELYGELLGRASARVLISIPISGFRAPVRPVR